MLCTAHFLAGRKERRTCSTLQVYGPVGLELSSSDQMYIYGTLLYMQNHEVYGNIFNDLSIEHDIWPEVDNFPCETLLKSFNDLPVQCCARLLYHLGDAALVCLSTRTLTCVRAHTHTSSLCTLYHDIFIIQQPHVTSSRQSSMMKSRASTFALLPWNVCKNAYTCTLWCTHFWLAHLCLFNIQYLSTPCAGHASIIMYQ